MRLSRWYYLRGTYEKLPHDFQSFLVYKFLYSYFIQNKNTQDLFCYYLLHQLFLIWQLSFLYNTVLSTQYLFLVVIFFFQFQSCKFYFFFHFLVFVIFVSPYNVTAIVVIMRCHFLLMMSSFVYITHDDIINKEFLTKIDNMNQN